MAKKPVQIAISKATGAQLREYAVQNLGGAFPASYGDEDCRAAVTAALGGSDYFTLVENIAPDAIPGGVAPAMRVSDIVVPRDDTDEDARMDQKVTVQIHPDEKNPHPVPVAVNGVAMLIPRGKPVQIKRKYAEVLFRAVKEVAVLDPDTSKIVGYRMTHTYPFSVQSSDPEIMALSQLPMEMKSA